MTSKLTFTKIIVIILFSAFFSIIIFQLYKISKNGRYNVVSISYSIDDTDMWGRSTGRLRNTSKFFIIDTQTGKIYRNTQNDYKDFKKLNH
jgi:hypothetical protein